LDFPADIRFGIELHRFIDHYTDHHPLVMISKKRLYPVFHKYAPVVVDVYYDHFLAKKWEQHSPISLEKYSLDFYQSVEEFDQWMPERTRYMFAYMSKQNWLYSYQSLEGIDQVFKGMARRTPFESNMHMAAKSLEENYLKYEKEFETFFPEIISECKIKTDSFS